MPVPSDLTLKHTLESSLVSLSLCVLYFQADYSNLKGADAMQYPLIAHSASVLRGLL